MIKKFDTFTNETFGMDLPKESNSITEKDSDSVMAKSQLTRTKDFVDMLIPIIEGMDDMEPWVQAKITKAEDYLNAVLNYYKGKGGVNEAKRGVVHKAAKKGSYPVSIVVIKDGKVIAQELVKTPAEVPAAFNVIQSYHKHKGATVHIESKTGERLFSESLDEAVLDEFVLESFNIEKLHFEMDPKKAEKLKIELGKSHGEIGKRNQIESGNYSLKKFRKTIGYWDGNKKDNDFAEGVFAGPEHYNTVRSTLGAGPHKKKIKKVRWNSKEYNKWLKTMATDNDGVGQDSSYGFEMAQNAEFEPGLIDWVKKSFRGEDPLQRIQWDIEGMMESVNLAVNEAEKYITNEYKVGDKIKTDFGEWEVIETDYKPGKSFIAPFIFKGKDMERANIPNPPKTNKKAVGYKVTDGDKYPITGFLYQYKGNLGSKSLITKLATVGIDESLNEGSDQARLTHLRKFGIAPNNQPQNAAYIKQVSKPGKFFVDWKDAFKLGDVALEFIKSSGSESVFDIIDLKTMKRIGKQLDVKKGDLGNLRTTYGVRVNESINEGKVTKKSISKASDDLAKIIIELKDNLGKLQKSKTDEERAKYIEIAKDLTIKRKDASESLNLAIAKLDKNAELDLNGKD